MGEDLQNLDSMAEQQGSHDWNTEQQPSAKWCFVCGVNNPAGLKIRFFNDGHYQVKATVTLGEEYQSYPGVAHGGILATIMDETMGRAILADGGPERFMFTAKLDVRYRQAVPLNKPFVATGRVDTMRGRMVHVSGKIVLPNGTTAVKATATLVDIPAEQLDAMLTQDVGWQVYPEE